MEIIFDKIEVILPRRNKLIKAGKYTAKLVKFKRRGYRILINVGGSKPQRFMSPNRFVLPQVVIDRFPEFE